MMDWGPPSPLVDGKLKLRVEWSLLDGTRANGKFIFTSDPLVNERKLASDIIDALVDDLNDKFPGEDYVARDVVLWGA